MSRRNRFNLVGILLIIVFTMIIIGVIYIAPTHANELQLLARALFVISLVVTFLIITKRVKSNRRKQF